MRRSSLAVTVAVVVIVGGVLVCWRIAQTDTAASSGITASQLEAGHEAVTEVGSLPNTVPPDWEGPHPWVKDLFEALTPEQKALVAEGKPIPIADLPAAFREQVRQQGINLMEENVKRGRVRPYPAGVERAVREGRGTLTFDGRPDQGDQCISLSYISREDKRKVAFGFAYRPYHPQTIPGGAVAE